MVPRHVAAMLSPSSSCSIFYVNWFAKLSQY
jgi:hypothetical protein